MNVLFVCSDNSVLSVMAESILKGVAVRRFAAFSAGCLPRESIDGYVIELLSAHRLPVAGLHPKGLERFRFASAPRMDFIITLCDLAAAELWQEWPGEPFVAHWNVWDRRAPASPSPEAAIRDGFWTLKRRIQIFATLAQRKMSRRALQERTLTLESGYL